MRFAPTSCCWGYFCIFVHLRLCCAILFARSRLALHWTTNEKKGKPLENPKKTCPTWIIFIQTQNSFRTICLRILQASWKQSHVSCISTWHENRLLLGGVVICFFVITKSCFTKNYLFNFVIFFFLIFSFFFFFFFFSPPILSNLPIFSNLLFFSNLLVQNRHILSYLPNWFWKSKIPRRRKSRQFLMMTKKDFGKKVAVVWETRLVYNDL